MLVLTLQAVSWMLARHAGQLLRWAGKTATQPLARITAIGRRATYTSTGVRAPWVTEQQTAPAKAKREYRAAPVGASGAGRAASLALAASTLLEPVAVGGGAVDIVKDD